jgi:DNA damage-binding protein 1
LKIFYFSRIAYQESTQSFGVVTVRTELQDSCSSDSRPLRNSASLTAHNVTKSIIGAIASTGSTQPDGITFGNDVECGSFLIIDQHTFEGRYTLPGHNAPFSCPIN